MAITPDNDELTQRHAKFLREAACYFEKRDTGGEDMAFWSNHQNAENCRKIAAALQSQADHVKELEAERDNARANSVSRGKMLVRIRDTLTHVRANLDDRGDLVAFGSTNDADQLRDMVDELEEFKWDMIIREKDEDDLLSANQKANARIAALEAQVADANVLRAKIIEFANKMDEARRDYDAYCADLGCKTIMEVADKFKEMQAQAKAFREATTWRSVETAPHGVQVLLATPPFKCMGESAKWELKVGCYSWGERNVSYSTVSRDSYATLWAPLDALMAALKTEA